MLSPIHNAGIRIATGAFRTSPIAALLAEANVPPLEIRRKQLSLTYAVSKLATPSNPIHDLLIAGKYTHNPYTKRKYPKSLHLRLKECLQNIQMKIPLVFPREQFAIPPWTIKLPRIIDKFLQVSKNTDRSILQTLYLELTSDYPSHKQIFTDGSKSKEGTGCAVCTYDNKLLLKCYIRYSKPGNQQRHNSEDY
ncbi:uncharacterized protein LOC143265262 [Megachile rotundata]|uniref:uncharacterized protein LOC143265262 n=1 Tax=Megachile rotundata TaxID=143995 RepID=UPI003FD4623A